MEKTNQPLLLSLDLGTATGWALSNKHGRIMSGTAHFRPRRFEGGGMRYLRFERWLNETRDVSGEINAVYFEEVRRQLMAAFWLHSPHGVRSTASLTKAFRSGQSRSSSLAKAMRARQLLLQPSKPLAISPRMTTKPMRWLCCILPVSR